MFFFVVVFGCYDFDLLVHLFIYSFFFCYQVRKNDAIKLKSFRFFTTVLLENVPQIVVQTWYTFGTSSDAFTPLVLVSMTFTILSLLVSFFAQISRICQSRQRREKKFLNVDRATIRMTIKCGDLQTHHAFAHEKIAQCLEDVLDTNENLADLHHRKDVSVSMEVYSIKGTFCRLTIERIVLFCNLPHTTKST